MKYVIMVSHGELASGLHSAVKMMTGDRSDVMSIDMLEQMSVEEFTEAFRSQVSSLTKQDQVILLADIMSGLPFSSALNVLDEKGLMNDAVVLAGANLPLVITAILMKDNVGDCERLKELMLCEGHAGLAEFIIAANDEEDEHELTRS